MAETKQILEREYVIPLRRAWLRVPYYERTGKAIKAIKIFVAKHMKVTNRDTDKVKLDVYFNNNLWFKGRANPPSKVKVKVRKEGELVHVTFVETPEYVKFLKAKHDKMHKKSDKKVEPKEEPKEAPAKTEEQKKDEKEKETAVAQQAIKDADMAAKADKHTTPVKTPKINRMALKK